jgi:pimeloyl-ACP methyl ester carboxylesterase
MQASAQQHGGSLLESEPWLVKNQGPDVAKGVLYFIHGYDRLKPGNDDFDGAPPFVVGLNRQGWDVIGAKIPNRASGTKATDLIAAIAPGLPAKADAFRKQGYKRVVLAGQSWGSWLALTAASRYRMKADGLILIAPATYGERSREGKPNPDYMRNGSDFLPLIAGDSLPSIVAFFKDDEYDPGGRGPVTQSTFDKRAVPHILIDAPAGFVGHAAAWFPLFDYAFGDCFAAFLAAPATTTCSPPPLDDADFRAVLAKSQIADAESHPLVAPSDLAGRRYVSYADDGVERLLRFDGEQNMQAILPNGNAHRVVSSRNGAICFDNRCLNMVKWDSHRLIAFDPQNGAATAWWTELDGAP